MHRIISIKDKRGKTKRKVIRQIKRACPSMTGEILCPEFMDKGSRFCLIYEGSSMMLRTSPIVKYIDTGEKVKVVTENSVYKLEKVRDSKITVAAGTEQYATQSGI